jgi:hypothetical protein
MNTTKKRESFTNEYYDDENYSKKSKFTEPKRKFTDSNPNNTTNQETDPKQKLRLFLLDQIQDVQDKTVKANLLDYLFSDSVMNNLSTMGLDDQKKFVQKTIANMSTAPKQDDTVAKEETPPPKSQFIPDMKDYSDNSTPNIMNQVSTQLDNVLKNIDQMKDGITNIKSMFVNKGVKEPYIPTLPQLPKAGIEQFTSSIQDLPNGFENLRTWGATL